MIRNRYLFLLVLPFCFMFTLHGFSQSKDPVKVVIVTGGHEFEHNSFFSMFLSDDIHYTAWEQPAANQNIADGKAHEFDVIVLYDLWQKISKQEKEGYLSYLKSGKGIVALHHCIGSYQTWDEFVQIIGGTYVMNDKPRIINGESYSPSFFIHDKDLSISIADAEHPVTVGIKDFVIFDEVYGNFHILNTVHPLLKTNHPENTPVIGWVNRYANANNVYIQLGHGPSAFENPNLVKLVQQAIRWVANGVNE